MKSVYYEQYGPSEVLSLREMPKPEPGPDQVLIRVHAVSLNPLDWRLMKADPFIIRLFNGLLKPKIHVLGADFSGVIAATGEKVSGFEPGDALSGIMTPEITGTLAEYIVLPATGIVKNADTLSHQQASTLGVAALTAYEGIYDYRIPTPGDRVLINGASGGIGTFAVQMAKALGGHVTAVCSQRNEDLVRSLGADEVIDYQSVNLLTIQERFDLIYDTIGNHPPMSLKRLLKEGGKMVLASAEGKFGFFKAIRVSKKEEDIDLIVDLKKDQPRLQSVMDLAAAGTILPVIDREVPFEEVREAIDYVSTKRARGKVIVNIAST